MPSIGSRGGMCLGVAAVCSIAACCTPKAQLRVSQSGICKGNRVTITWTGTVGGTTDPIEVYASATTPGYLRLEPCLA